MWKDICVVSTLVAGVNDQFGQKIGVAVDLLNSRSQWPCTSLQKDVVMGNTSSERAAMCQGEKGRRDSRGNKEGERPKILMDSPEDADIFHGEDMKVSCAAVRDIYFHHGGAC